MGVQTFFLPPQWGPHYSLEPMAPPLHCPGRDCSHSLSYSTPAMTLYLPLLPSSPQSIPYCHTLTPTSISHPSSHIRATSHVSALPPPLQCPSRPGPAQHPLTSGTPPPPAPRMSDSRTAGSAQQVKFPSDR